MSTVTPTKDRPVTLPTEAELERAVRGLRDANELLIHLAWRVRRVADVEAVDSLEDSEIPSHRRHPGDEVPSFEAIGRMYSYAADMRRDLEEITRAVEDIGGQKALWDLDSTRVVAAFQASKMANDA
jgi:hypothetical protein